MSARLGSRLVFALALVLGLAALPASAQPFGGWAQLNGTPGYVEIPHSTALNPLDAITLEAWVKITLPTPGENCKSLIGKNYTQAYWVGVCNAGSPAKPTLRSYLRNAASRTAGVVPAGKWTHIAVTFDGSTHRHYINGELALEVASPGQLGQSTAPVRIASDVAWPNTPTGEIDDFRLWNVARTQAQIREALNEIQGPQPGLVGNWRLATNGNNAVSINHHGTVNGNFPFTGFGTGLTCATSASLLCLRNRFAVKAEWRTGTGEGSAGVVPFQTADSGLLHFFGVDNWEIQLKILDGCGLNSRYWAYFAATTDQFFRIEILDRAAGVQKIYFNYPGAPAQTVTDVDAFATCP